MNNSRLYKPEKETYLIASQRLKDGDLVSFPTETVYGLGADARNGRAVSKIFSTKNRPSFNPLIVHVSDHKKAQYFVELSDLALKLANAFWPGPFTMVLPKKKDSDLSELISAGLETIAIRVPENKVANELLKTFDGPIAAPSANKSGKISPTTADHVDGEFSSDELQIIIDGGPCDKGIESTIVQVTDSDVILLRPGSITAEDIEKVTGKDVTVNNPSTDKPNAPGQLESHYAPETKMRLNATEIGKGEALLGFGNVEDCTLNLSSNGDLSEAAANLFSMMRELDQMQFETIGVSPIPEAGLGIAINDRLRRAAAPKDNG